MRSRRIGFVVVLGVGMAAGALLRPWLDIPAAHAQAPGAARNAEVGRYQLILSSPSAGGHPYVIDTKTGEVWRHNLVSPRGQPTRSVWDSLGSPAQTR